MVSLNSEQYRSWMLANPLFVCLTCIRPGAYLNILGESGVFNPLVTGVSYMLHFAFFGAVTRILTCKSSLTARL